MLILLQYINSIKNLSHPHSRNYSSNIELIKLKKFTVTDRIRRNYKNVRIVKSNCLLALELYEVLINSMKYTGGFPILRPITRIKEIRSV